MYTVDSLLTIAADAESRIRKQDFVFPEGIGFTTDLWTLREWAMACAEWMDSHNLTELPFVGPFGTPSIKTGDRVRIKKGAVISNTGPHKGKVAGRDYVVTVHRIAEGYVHTHNRREIVVRQPYIEWAGAGGYWHWTDPSNVELVMEDA